MTGDQGSAGRALLEKRLRAAALRAASCGAYTPPAPPPPADGEAQEGAGSARHPPPVLTRTVPEGGVDLRALRASAEAAARLASDEKNAVEEDAFLHRVVVVVGGRAAQDVCCSFAALKEAALRVARDVLPEAGALLAKTRHRDVSLLLVGHGGGGAVACVLASLLRGGDSTALAALSSRLHFGSVEASYVRQAGGGVVAEAFGAPPCFPEELANAATKYVRCAIAGKDPVPRADAARLRALAARMEADEPANAEPLESVLVGEPSTDDLHLPGTVVHLRHLSATPTSELCMRGAPGRITLSERAMRDHCASTYVAALTKLAPGRRPSILFPP